MRPSGVCQRWCRHSDCASSWRCRRGKVCTVSFMAASLRRVQRVPWNGVDLRFLMRGSTGSSPLPPLPSQTGRLLSRPSRKQLSGGCYLTERQRLACRLQASLSFLIAPHPKSMPLDQRGLGRRWSCGSAGVESGGHSARRQGEAARLRAQKLIPRFRPPSVHIQDRSIYFIHTLYKLDVQRTREGSYYNYYTNKIRIL